jgi:hypothetical protein
VLEHPQGVNGTLRIFNSELISDIFWGKTNQIAVVNFFALSDYSNGSNNWLVGTMITGAGFKRRQISTPRITGRMPQM